MSMLDLSQLPVPDVIETLDFEVEYEETVARFRAAMGDQWDANLESDPVVKELELIAYEKVTLRARINAAARAVLLASSTGNDLDGVLALLDAKRLEGELDPAFKARGRLAPYGFSTAGPFKAYEYHALSAHEDVRSVWVDRPTPGVVRVTVLSRLGDGVPTDEVLAAVRVALNAEDVRPLNDTVLVEAAYAIPWTLHARLHFTSGAAYEPVMVAAQAAASAYALAQHKVKTPIRENMLIAALGLAGVSNVELLIPTQDIEAQLQGAPYCTSIVLEPVVDYE